MDFQNWSPALTTGAAGNSLKKWPRIGPLNSADSHADIAVHIPADIPVDIGANPSIHAAADSIARIDGIHPLFAA